MLSLDLSLPALALRGRATLSFRITLEGVTYERLALAGGEPLTLPSGEALYVRIF